MVIYRTAAGLAVNLYTPAEAKLTVGKDVALEAIKWAIRDRMTTPAEIWKIAERCRAKSLVGPYLELLSA